LLRTGPINIIVNLTNYAVLGTLYRTLCCIQQCMCSINMTEFFKLFIGITDCVLCNLSNYLNQV